MRSRDYYSIPSSHFLTIFVSTKNAYFIEQFSFINMSYILMNENMLKKTILATNMLHHSLVCLTYIHTCSLVFFE